MKKLTLLFLILLATSLVVWNCKEEPTSVTNTVPFHIVGNVQNASSSANVVGATVQINLGSRRDSTLTDEGGQFQFIVDGNPTSGVRPTFTIRKDGFQTRTVTLTVVRDTFFVVGLQVNLATFATITGSVRDSISLYPLRSSRVFAAIPGVVETTSTQVDGSFSLLIDLVDRDSLPVSMTISKTGYKAKQFISLVRRGATKNLGNVRMTIDAGSTTAQVLGTVFDATKHTALANAVVKLTSSLRTDSIVTGPDGKYTFTFDLGALGSLDGKIRGEKTGFQSDNFDFSVQPGQSYNRDLSLTRDTTTGVPRDSSGGTGNPHSIALISVTAHEITVAGVGGLETSTLTWEVRDSLGYPVDIDHKDTVVFNLVGTPTGGPRPAYVSPSQIITNVSGRVATTINSGTIAGVVQLSASLRRESDGQTVQTAPVVITVNAGSPDQLHFSLGPTQHNFAGYDWIGIQDEIGVQVGDRYSNPVHPGTAVYFNSTGGVIQASGFTNEIGHADVTLYSGNPQPVELNLPQGVFGVGADTGYAWVRAFTKGENGVDVGDSTIMLFSASAQITADFSALTSNVLVVGECVIIPVTISETFLNLHLPE